MAERVAEHVARFGDGVGASLADGDLPLSTQIMRLKESIDGMDAAFKSFAKETKGQLSSLGEAMIVLTDAVQTIGDGLKSKGGHLEEDVALSERSLGSEATSTSQWMEVLEPKVFQGIRNAKRLEIFLWDMERYFEVAHIPDEEQVAITSLYLAGNAKLWWQNRVQEGTSMGRPRIDDWETMKKELMDQFLPCDARRQARESLKKRQRHTGKPREYIKEWRSLMLGKSVQRSMAEKEEPDRQEWIHKMVSCEGGSSSHNLGDA